MILPIAIVACLLAVVLLTLALRGRRVDDHPLCRRCGYDLTGRPDGTTRCGECGADLTPPNAVRSGHRVRRARPLVMGIALLTPSVAVAAMAGWVQARDVALTPYEPVWWLRRELDRGPAARDVALAELTARLTAGRLSDGQVAAVADRALAAELSPAPWVPAWGTFVESAWAARRLDRQRWGTYLRQSFTPATLTASSAVRQGDPFQASIGIGGFRRAKAKFVAFFDIGPLRMDGMASGEAGPIGSGASRAGRLEVWDSGWGMSSRVPQLDGGQTRALTLGAHSVSSVLQVDLYDVADVIVTQSGPEPPSGSAKRLATFALPALGRFTVVPARPTVPRVMAPQQRTAVAAAIRDVTVHQQDARLIVVRARLDRPQVRLAFAVALRSPDGRELVVHGMCGCAAGQSVSANGAALGSLGSADHVDVIFRPDAGVTDERSDLTPIWGEEVVVRDVPVKQGFP